MSKKPSAKPVFPKPQPHGVLRLVLFIILVVVLLAIPAILFAQLAPITPFAGTASVSLLVAIRSIVNALLSLAALIAAIYIVIGGVRYVTSQGDENAAAQAKSTVIFAMVGAIIIALSAVLVNFIINAIP